MPPQPHVQLGEQRIADPGKTFVIAEAGVNHNGDTDMALRLITAAAQAGADCVKFQTFRADRVAGRTAPKAAYQLQTTDRSQSQLDMLRAMELSQDDYRQIIDHCHASGVMFLSTPYDPQDADLLESLGVAAYKIASGQAVEPLLLEHVARKGKPVILSTGMCTLDEVRRAAATIRQTGNDQLILLQCTTDYPSTPADANLRAMVTMRDDLRVPVGYSDHTTSLTTAIAAVALGACVVERHLTLDKSLPGPDQSCSLEPDGFRKLVEMIRETELALGSPTKAPCAAELRNLPGVRRGVVAIEPIRARERFTTTNLGVRRPTSPLGGEDLPDLLGRQAAVDIEPDTPITPEMIL